ncbi:hypothetical protein T12_7878 [Trichinella patagoniensis]|uniref:Uncharacterized protein n=1 Tax=Trichinella patagoniensis TaxID=990121 RepID=A0A0V0YZ39_9BILA|nr:hypothetical protein T12_9370 [Trichinella patagoniensis]KRY05490.1 hypothetical protein T12_7878 [Trichinella patagoniensis]
MKNTFDTCGLPRRMNSGFCVVISMCSFVSIDKCSPSWNKTGVR